MDDVLPFLENVLRGKNVPRQRMLEVAEHYRQFDGISPINQQNRDLLAAIENEFRNHGIDLPVYWGNRNWHPLFAETLAQMKQDGRQRALAFFTSMYSSYSGCRQYREDIINAQNQVGDGAPIIEKVRMGFNHPGFIGAMVQRVRSSLTDLAVEPSQATVLFSAHSIPNAMAENCDYEKQLTESAHLIAEQIGLTRWGLVYQSRSGPPQQPWLEPDICDAIASLHRDQPISHLVIAPIGFISDHIEVLYDLDDEAAEVCRELGIPMSRAATAGTHPEFVKMIRMLVEERLGRGGEKLSLGSLGPWHDVCPQDCCQYTPRRPGRPA